MNLKNIERVLMQNNRISDVIKKDETNFQGKVYKYIIECKLSILEKHIPIIVGIPENWQMNLFDVYIKNKESIDFIPHIDTHGKICLFDLEGSLIDTDFDGLLLQSVMKAISTIEDGLNGYNRLDFIDEFDSYWLQLPNIKRGKFVVPNKKKTQLVKYVSKKADKKGKEYVDYLNSLKKEKFFISNKIEDLEIWKLNGETKKNAIYFFIEPKKYIFPPDGRYKLKLEYVNDLLEYVDAESIKGIYSKISKNKLLIFEIKQPNGVYTLLGIILNNASLKFDKSKVEIKCIDHLYPIFIKRCDKLYLTSRTNSTSNNLVVNKKLLLIGCGSIGGYVANELVKSGFEKITLIDNDFLYEENIYRHLLGIEYVDKYKCVALQEYLNKNIPCLSINSLVDNIEDAVYEGNIDFKDYDIIISAIGNHNVNRWINKYIFKNKIDVPLIYTWNEVLGIGNHIAYIKYGNMGCYECFIGRDEETMEIYDKTSYCNPGQKISKKVSGCGTSFIPYSSRISLKTTVMCMDVIQKVIEGRYITNMIISSKGEDFYFKSAGLITSNKYEKQEKNIVEYSGEQFENCNCSICRGMNDN